MHAFQHHHLTWILYHSLILLATWFDSSTTTTAAAATGHLYRQVQTYQVLQRQRDTNTAWVETVDGEQHELLVGGPYTVDDAHHVMVGDLWILAGQSNMEGYAFFDQRHHHGMASHVFQSNESWGLVPANEPVHYLATSSRLVHHMLPDPTVTTPTVLFDRGASLGPAFAHHYQQSSGVPVGLVPCAHGGVTLQQWMKHQPQKQQQSFNDANTTLYGAMLDTIRLVGGSVMGVLWYQGESDAVQLPLAQQYQPTFTQWLDQLYLDLPTNPLFVFAQIGRYVISSQATTADDDLGWTLVRKAQLDVFIQQQQQRWRNNMAIVSTLDMDMDDEIHLSAPSLRTVGRRMADEAIRLVNQKQQRPVLYGSTATMLHVPYANGRYWRPILRLDFGHPAPTWLHQQQDRRVMGFTIHDRQLQQLGAPPLDIIYSARINKDHQIDLYLTENGYQQLAAQGQQQRQQEDRFVLWYGYGKNPHCNLVTTDNQAALAFGPLSINVTRI